MRHEVTIKVLALVSSFRRSGNTAGVVAIFGDRLKAYAMADGEQLEVETLFLGHQEISTCQGCRTCFSRGEAACPLVDAIPAIEAKMVAADGLIVASPIYVDDVNGIMKNWIDRLAYLCHRPRLGGKPAILLTTVGGGPSGHALTTLERALRGWGAEIAGRAGFKTGALSSRKEIADRHGRPIERLVGRFYRVLAADRPLRPSLYSLLYFVIKQRYWRSHADGSLDYRFWRDQGWLDPRRFYYTPLRRSPATLSVGAVGALLTPFLT